MKPKKDNDKIDKIDQGDAKNDSTSHESNDLEGQSTGQHFDEDSHESSDSKKGITLQKEVKINGLNEYHRTAIIEPIGYKIGETAKCPFILNSSFEFVVTGEKQQILIF